MPKTPKKTGAANRSTKARILETAEEVFAAKGFAGASTREIAGRVGVNISSLHYHWGSKETLYFAVFQNIYERILDLVRRSIPEAARESDGGGASVEGSMAALLDFFTNNPNVPKLLVRRLLENEESRVDIEGGIFVPAWDQFAEWMAAHRGRKLDPTDSPFFMLTIYSVLLLFLLDSRHFKKVLGGSVYTPPVRNHVREGIVALANRLLGP